MDIHATSLSLVLPPFPPCSTLVLVAKMSLTEDIVSYPWKIVTSLLFQILVIRTDTLGVLKSVPPTALMAPTLRAYDIVAVPNETTSIIIIDD